MGGSRLKIRPKYQKVNVNRILKFEISMFLLVCAIFLLINSIDNNHKTNFIELKSDLWTRMVLSKITGFVSYVSVNQSGAL